MDSKETMKLALEALEGNTTNPVIDPEQAAIEDKAITALREALAEQPAQQEPVAYAVYHRMGGSKSLHWHEQHSPDGDANEYQLLPLYASPQAQRTWVGLTDEQIDSIVAMSCKKDSSHLDAARVARAIEAKLEEKNT